jgi:DNA helicase INO80
MLGFFLQEQDAMEDFDFEEGLLNLKDEDDPDSFVDMPPVTTKSSKAKKKDKQAKNPEIMAIRRRKIWVMMSKKELGKVRETYVVIGTQCIMLFV